MIHDSVLGRHQTGTTLLSGFASPIVNRKLSLVLEPSRSKGEGTILGGFSRIHASQSHGLLRSTGPHGRRFVEVLERFIDCRGGEVLLNASGDIVLVLERSFELLNAIVDLTRGSVQFIEGGLVVLFSLFVIEFELVGFAILLNGHVFLPVIHTLLVPLLHESSIPLQLVDLDSAEIRRSISLLKLVMGFSTGSVSLLTNSFSSKFSQVFLHVESLLRLVKCLKALLEKGVLDPVVGLFSQGDLLDGLSIGELASCLQHLDIRRGVDLLEHHLKLV